MSTFMQELMQLYSGLLQLHGHPLESYDPQAPEVRLSV
jgi:hypothetical protein